MTQDESNAPNTSGNDTFTRRGGYTTDDVEMVIPPVPAGPAPGTAETGTENSSTEQS